MQPQDREALDWLTLVRFLGWDVEVVSPADDPRGWRRRIGQVTVIACDPDAVDEEAVDAIASRLNDHPALVVCRAAPGGTPLARLASVSLDGEARAGRSIEWRGPGAPRAWRSARPLDGQRLFLQPDARSWATIEGAPVVAARPYGRGVVATLGIHPSEARDTDPSGTALMKTLLTWGVPPPVAWLDFDETLVLRMDDPGGAQNVHSRSWCYPKLSRDAWAAVGRDLAARRGRISLGYISGWVDDGDESRGRLTIEGRAVARRPGAVYPSPLVRYEDVAGHLPGTVHDYTAEFQGIQALRQAGVADVELHGFTHMHPDREAWVRAADRFESGPATAWFREFGRAAVPALERLAPADHPLARAMGLFREYFGTRPTTLICPGDQWTDATIVRALEFELQLVASYYLAIRHQDRLCWAQHVCAPYLNQPDRSWFAGGLPVVGYFHDYELAREGAGWMTTWLDRWQEAGARRVIDFRELAAAVGCRLTLHEASRRLTLVLDRRDAPAPVRPFPVRLRTERESPKRMTVDFDGHAHEVDVETRADGSGRALLPVDSVTSRFARPGP
jgi:hypothetical protein